MQVTINGVSYIPCRRPEKITGDTLGGYLKFLRTSIKLSLDSVSEATSISKSTLWELENDRTTPTLRTAARLCDYYCGDISRMAQLSLHHAKNS